MLLLLTIFFWLICFGFWGRAIDDKERLKLINYKAASSLHWPT
jgi:hypothetical protein